MLRTDPNLPHVEVQSLRGVDSALAKRVLQDLVHFLYTREARKDTLIIIDFLFFTYLCNKFYFRSRWIDSVNIMI